MRRARSIAAIDIGSSAARITIAHLEPDGRIRPVFFHRYPVRLGAGAFASPSSAGEQLIVEPLVDELSAAAREMRRHLDAHHVHAFRAVATSAMREAQNGPAIAARVGELLGGPLRIIDGEEEAELSRSALVAAMARVHEPLPERALLLDLGGGSLELAEPFGAKRASLPVGTVRLLSALPSLRDALDADGLADVRAAIERRLHAALLASPFAERAQWQQVPLVGTGGNLEVMARLLPGPEGRPGIDLTQADQLVPEVARHSVLERQQRYHLRPERADLMLPALLIVTLLGAAFAGRFIRVPGSGLRDALLQQIVLSFEGRSG